MPHSRPRFTRAQYAEFMRAWDLHLRQDIIHALGGEETGCQVTASENKKDILISRRWPVTLPERREIERRMHAKLGPTDYDKISFKYFILPPS